MEPWRNPHLISFKSKVNPVILTFCFLFLRYDKKQSLAAPFALKCCYLW